MVAYWLRLDCPKCEPAHAFAARAGSGGDRTVQWQWIYDAHRFDRIRNAYVDALDACLARPHVTFAESQQEIEQLFRLRQSWRKASEALFSECLAPALDALGPMTLVSRCEHLMSLALAPLAALAKGDFLCALPWDTHPRITLPAVVELARQSQTWPRPRADKVTILVGTDLGDGGMFRHREDFVAGLDTAAVVSWSLSRERAFSHAKASGASVRTLTSEALLAAIEGQFGEYVQIVGHVARNALGVDRLVCADADVDLTTLLQKVREVAERGYRSPLLSVDLTTCASAGTLSEVFNTVGSWCVASRPSALHPAWASQGLETIYSRGFLDGTRSFHHAWLWATLLDEGPHKGSEHDHD